MLEVDQQSSNPIRYTDPDLETRRHSAEITRIEIDRFRAMVLSIMEQPKHLWVDSVGKLLSDSMMESGNNADTPPARLDGLLKNNWTINPASKMLYYRGDSGITFYCNGRSYNLPNSDQIIGFIQSLCELRFLSAASVDACRMQKSLIEMLLELKNTGTLLPAEE
jgi:ribosomal protein L16 Arg81 hydroxylase